MKKIFAAILLIATVLLTASCGKGTSVAIHAVILDNKVENLFVWDKEIMSLSESVTYKDKSGNETFKAEYYYEDAADIYSMYNICETIGDYKLYAYEGSVYTETEKGITAVVLFSSTYTEFLASYLKSDFPLDGQVLDQQSSSRKDGAVHAAYHTKLTPQQTAKLRSFGIDGTETIRTDYVITDDNFISSVDYTVIAKDETYLFANRSFVKGTEKKAGVFDSVSSLQKSLTVDFIFVGEEQQGRHFEIPSGVYLGIDTADYEYEFFYDEACTEPYEHDRAVITENTVLYVRAKA
ncbi:MAG: hypothetical protein IKM00_01995 [Clostridia bacterium]|nr:hypothetical protein [Clostridia bacterium]MBR6743975.1 hypothetical protein [Clostridia bacterium]